ncbi:MAG: GEVED domain-containing protein, partial [bacterium]
MKTNIKNLSIKASLLMLLFGFLFTVYSNTVTAQDNGPEGYCQGRQWFDDKYAGSYFSYYYYCYPDYDKMYPSSYSRGMGEAIEYIKITPKNNPSEVILFSNTGEDFNSGSESACYQYFGNDYDGSGQFVPGDEYNVEIKVKSWYIAIVNSTDYCTYYVGSSYQTWNCARLFIDWNKDGDWVDVAPAAEYIQWWDTRASGSWCESAVFTGTFTVPADVDPGKTRLRVAAAGVTGSVYPSAADRPNPCINGYYYSYDYGSYGYAYMYDYGETEDYLIEFIIPIKGTYPEAGDVLFAQRDYDGTPKEINEVMEQFPRPMVELRDAAQPGTKITYRIRGPLPAKDIVYTGLDSKGNAQFDLNKPFSTKTPKIFEFFKSTGIYTTGAGEVNFEQSGEYYVELELYLPGKTTPKYMTKRFSVSWANDLSLQGISNPMKCYITDAKPFLKRY